MWRNRRGNRVFGKNRKRSTSCSQVVRRVESTGAGDNRGGGFQFADLDTAFLGGGFFSRDVAQGDHAGGAGREFGGSLVGALREVSQARVHAFGKGDLNFEATIFVRTRDIGAEVFQASGGDEIRCGGALGKEDGTVLQSALFGHRAVGVCDLGEIYFGQGLVEGFGGFWFWKLDQGEINFGRECGNGVKQENGGEELHGRGSIASLENDNEISMADT